VNYKIILQQFAQRRDAQKKAETLTEVAHSLDRVLSPQCVVLAKFKLGRGAFCAFKLRANKISPIAGQHKAMHSHHQLTLAISFQDTNDRQYEQLCVSFIK
jgi:hypothetical protein